MMYEYKCTKCGHIFEWIVDSEDEKVVCEKCKEPAQRVKIALSKHACRSSWAVK
jgi:putative FmdB family regulatory protein